MNPIEIVGLLVQIVKFGASAGPGIADAAERIYAALVEGDEPSPADVKALDDAVQAKVVALE